MRRIAVLCACVLPMVAGEQVVLRNGFRIAADRHETEGAIVRLHTAGGVIEIPAASVQAYEQEEYVAPPPQPAASPAAQPSAAQPVPNPPVDPKRLLDQAAEKYGVPAPFLHAVARAESAYQTKALSHKGAIGVMQLMPATAADLGADPHDPAQNIDAGARHLRDLLVQYNGSSHRALSAYNAGPGAVQRHGGVPPYRETRNYVEKVIRTYQQLNKQQ